MNLFCINNQKKLIQEKLDKRFKKIFNSNQFILGSNVIELENKLSNFTKSKYCISTSSGTDALLISLMAIGVKKGDEVITTSLTYVSTVEVILRLGATPVFADIKKDSAVIDENDIKLKISKKTKAIIAVSLYGIIPNIREIKKFSKNIKIIEDAAQSFGSIYNKNYSCNLTDIGCTSFYPTKNLGGYGDGGAIFTNSKKLANKMFLIRNHGEKKKYNTTILGICGRLDELQAAVLNEKFKLFLRENKIRISNGKKLQKLISKFSIKINKKSLVSYNTFPILIKNRADIIKKLKIEKIQYNIYYPKPIHKQKFLNLNVKLPNTEKFCQQILNLPCHPYLTEKYFLRVKKIINDN